MAQIRFTFLPCPFGFVHRDEPSACDDAVDAETWIHPGWSFCCRSCCVSEKIDNQIWEKGLTFCHFTKQRNSTVSAPSLRCCRNVLNKSCEFSLTTRNRFWLNSGWDRVLKRHERLNLNCIFDVGSCHGHRVLSLSAKISEEPFKIFDVAPWLLII